MEVLKLGGLEVNWGTCSASIDKKPLGLTTAEFELLGLLAKSRGRVMTRERIMNDIKGIDWTAYDRSIDVLVSRLRQKLGDDPKAPTYILTVRGIGYRFVGGEHE